MVLAYCSAAGLDVMLKPVHIVPIWDSKQKALVDTIMPAIGLYRILAARTGQYGGISEPTFGPNITERLGEREITYPEWCKITVKRIIGSVIAEFTAIEYWKENYATKGNSVEPNAMWSRRSRGQLAKCAEAQALRKAFPEVGAQVTAEEMEGKEYIIEKDMGTIQPTATTEKKELPKFNSQDVQLWSRAVSYYKNNANLNGVEKAYSIDEQDKLAIMEQAKKEMAQANEAEQNG